jgi:hypothetical protein
MKMRIEHPAAAEMHNAIAAPRPHPAEVRIFDTDDMGRLRHGVAAALQALGFTVDGSNADPFLVSGARALGPARKFVVYVIPREEAQAIVRVESETLGQDMGEPPISERFFEALSRAMFLTAHKP